jgi:O-acetylhomoserine/O-acetylserine sulfhydrylase-like pyridoxal-dependent enzyme
MEFETRAMHEGQPPDPSTGAVIVPIYFTSTYSQDAIAQQKGYERYIKTD